MKRIGDRANIWFARCHCGQWEFSDRDLELNRIDSRPDRWLLSAWLRHRFDRTGQPFRYSDHTDKQLPSDLVEPPVQQKIDETVLFIGSSSEGFGSYLQVNPADWVPQVWARGQSELNRLLLHLLAAGLAEDGTSRKDDQTVPKKMALTAKGWERFDELRPLGGRGRLAFVAMNFSAELDQAYDQAIEPSLRDCGYEPDRLKGKHISEKVDDHLIAQLRRAALIVADCTGQRPNVYFEAGFAMGLGVPVIWCCRKGEQDAHFDVRQYPRIEWSNTTDLRDQLTARILALYSPNASRKPR